MCGIFGFLRFHQEAENWSPGRQLGRALAHRGPDGDGLVSHGPAAIGNCRLSIIGLDHGAQPIANEDKSIWVTCNGEIYNWRELRDTLRSRGHDFRTASDSEVVVHAYEEWGDACVARFRGMFALGILDTVRNRLFLARDHFGIKPLYYLRTAACFAFASELQALRSLPEGAWDLDLEALDEYLELQYIPAPRTIYRQVRKLPAASRVGVSFNGHCTGVDEYWRPEFRAVERPDRDAVEELSAVLRDSVRVHLAAEVPVGAFLSGGLDSSTVVGFMAELQTRPLRTFSVGVEGAESDELDAARTVARIVGAEHAEVRVTPDALALLPDLVGQFGEPYGDSSAIPTYYASRLAREHATVVLGGDGGDELFAGYESYVEWLESLASPAAGRVGPPRPDLAGYLRVIRHTQPEWRRTRLWRPELAPAVPDTPNAYRDAWGKAKDLTDCRIAQLIDLRTYLPDDVLLKVDLASMRHGLEARTPFLDVRVAELALSIPAGLNIRPGAGGRWLGKRLLRALASRWYPHSFTNRVKQGFGLPVADWFGRAPLASDLRGRLADPASPLRRYFQVEGLQQANARGSGYLKWIFLCLDEWLRQEEDRS